MTQEYTPIELDENTPEPTADGIYLLTITMGDETRTYPTTKEDDMWLTDDYCTWKDLLSEMSQADRVTIQSLAAHDAQIRAKAWDEGFTEGRDLAVSGRPMSRNNPYREQKQ
jgi:hypothetical protein